MTDRAEYFRLYKAKQREKARNAGLCLNCCKRKTLEGKATCEHCIVMVGKANKRAKRAARKIARQKGNAA